MFVGGLVATVGIVAIAIIAMLFPAPPTFDVAAMVQSEERKIDDMSVSDTWMFWLRDIEGPGLTKFPNPQDHQYEQKKQASLFGLLFFAALFLVGGAIALTALFWKRPSVQRP